MTIDAIIRSIQLMLAPVVMVTACSSYINTLSYDYQSIVSSIRSMSREHLNLLQAASSSEPWRSRLHDNEEVGSSEACGRNAPRIMSSATSMARFARFFDAW